MTKLTLHDVFPYGEHRGETLYSIIVCDPEYIRACLETVPGFTLDDEAHGMFEIFLRVPVWHSPGNN